MLNRIKQFYSAITAKITEQDREFVNAQLNTKEKALFFGMNMPDQRHVLNVAYTALHLAEGKSAVDKSLLVRCALLHDVGKVRGDVSTWDKVMTVLAHRFAPTWAHKWGRLGRAGRLDNLRHAFYIYFHHPARGAELLTQAGTDLQIINIVRKHHKPTSAEDCVELQLLKQADSLN